MAQKPQGEGEHNAHHNGHAAVLDNAVEAGREANDGVGHHIVQQDNADGGQRVRRILNVAHAQQQLDQAVQQRGAHAPLGAVTMSDHDQRQHTAEGDATAQRPCALELEQAQYRTHGHQNGALHQPANVFGIHGFFLRFPRRTQ